MNQSSTALVFDEREFSLEQLDRLADGFALALADRGVRAGERAALMSSNRPEFVVATHALWRLGAAVVLVSPAWKHDEVGHALAVSGATHAIGDNAVLADLMPMMDLDDAVPPATHSFRTVDPRSDSVLVFSSGTTGLPKAVRHTHASFAVAVEHWRTVLELTADDRLQIVTPPTHILGLLNIETALNTGARIRLHRRFDLERMLHCIEDDRITVEMAVAPIALALASHPDLESFDLSSLRYIMWGATPVTASVAEEVTRRTGVPWVPAYGASELPVIACNPIEGARLDSVGRPAPGVQIRVVSLETGESVPTGDDGEIQARSESVMAGYLPSAETAGAFSDKWYRTGDVGHVDADGWITLTDRVKEMIKVKGFQVAPAEIEAVLHGHPAVSDCAVFGVPDAATGERIVAAVTTSAPVDESELRDLVAHRLASYKRLSEVTRVSEIPRLPSGKVLRRVLKERHGRPTDG